jgi:ABC-type branched-subunit amino acid transport system ATPase component
MPTSSAEPRSKDARLVVSGVTAGYGSVPVIRDVDVSVSDGEVVSIVGPNGAGKSTLLKAIVGILQPSAGTVRLGQREIAGMRTDRIARAGVGYVPQVKDVFETLTVHENLEMGGYTLKHGELAARIREVEEIYPALAAMRERYAGNLSGGERKMLAMGRVLMTSPSLLVLDEPTAGLAPQLANELLREHVARLAETGVGILLVEQHARESLAISDWAYVMASGQIQLSDVAATLLARPDIGDIFLGRIASAVG